MLDIDAVTTMHHEMIDRWHERDVDNPYTGFMAIACRQCGFNYRLWHEEDIVQSRRWRPGDCSGQAGD